MSAVALHDVGPPAAADASRRAVSLETVGMTKIFGSLVALEDVSIKVRPGTLLETRRRIFVARWLLGSSSTPWCFT